jgi:hypothetical protein
MNKRPALGNGNMIAGLVKDSAKTTTTAASQPVVKVRDWFIAANTHEK